MNLPASAHSSRGRTPWALGKKVVLALGFWSGIGLLFSTQLYVLSPGGTWVDAMETAMPRWYAWGLLTPLIILADRRLIRGSRLGFRLLLHLPAGLLSVFAVETLRYGAHTALQAGAVDSALVFYVRGAYWDILIYGLIVGLYIAWDLSSEAQRRRLREAKLEANLAEAHLQALQTQLRPHFLFNALNTISAYTITDPRVARRMMGQLGDLLRASLDHADGPRVPFGRELALLDDYLAIERLRFKGRLSIRVSIDDAVRDALVPVFLLQPLVENAIRHGINAQMQSGHVHVHGYRDDRWLCIVVEDSGVGLPDDWCLEDHGGIGLLNTVQRLEELYGPDHEFQIDSAPGEGVRIGVVIPYTPASPVSSSAAPIA